jgi:hypothetical protein
VFTQVGPLGEVYGLVLLDDLNLARNTICTLISLSLISLAGLSYSQMPQVERDALVALYSSTDGANWKDNTD